MSSSLSLSLPLDRPLIPPSPSWISSSGDLFTVFQGNCWSLARLCFGFLFGLWSVWSWIPPGLVRLPDLDSVPVLICYRFDFLDSGIVVLRGLEFGAQGLGRRKSPVSSVARSALVESVLRTLYLIYEALLVRNAIWGWGTAAGKLTSRSIHRSL